MSTTPRCLHPRRACLWLALLTAVASAVSPAAAQDLDPALSLSANGAVLAVAAQPNGKILLGGNFSALGSTNRSRLARLNADGTLDTAFDPNINTTVFALAVQPDGKILVGGGFSNAGGVLRPIL